MEDITKLENRLWESADQLRVNSKLTSNEYCMPVLGLIFLRHANNRYLIVKNEIEKSLPKRGGVARPLTKDDFARKSALFLQEKSQYDYLLENEKAKQDRADAIIKAMETIEADYEALAGVLPKDYQIFDNDLLARLLKIFNDEVLRNTNGDVFGRIYEYFLMKFAMQGAQDQGEFFTPVSLVQTIVNVIEPDHGIVFDPACGSGGMFVQTSHFLETVGKSTHESVTFFGQEKTATTIRLAKMNLAVHGLEGKILEGNTFYDDNHNLLGKANFVMANPPFNVDSVDARKIKGDPRLPFDLPGVNQKGAVSNGNYLWISYFYSYLKEKGRAGFVMSSQASSAGHGEKDVRQKIIETGDVDIMISIRSNFFYTRSVPCDLWFFDKDKPKDKQDKVLMIDARNIFRKVTRKVYDFSPEQLQNINSIVWLYRGQTEKFLALAKEYLLKICKECRIIPDKFVEFEKMHKTILNQVFDFKGFDESKKEEFKMIKSEWDEAFALFDKDKTSTVSLIDSYQKKWCVDLPGTNDKQHKAKETFVPIAERIKGLIKQVDLVYKLAMRMVDYVEKELDAKNNETWDARASNKNKKDLD
ncbi:MAG: type I restriction-modification system subunit M, partial [Candidatus Omnitrophica bacterium]|nr:type I restriction-modification system subunit M [Candidatus Omnitrophota bacterium]MBU1996192.1 type I restriction-modification system subunit M [Candidatus Omnitrophota bacterium]